MPTYEITITETLKKNVFIEAETMVEAERKARSEYKEQKHVLTGDNFVDVDFNTKSIIKGDD